ncbi:MAG: sulfur transferase domain-containing protein [Planctomycetota bacterium]
MQYTTLSAFCLFALILGGCHADPTPAHRVAPVEPTSCGNVKNMHQIGDLYVAGGVTPSDYPLLKELGIKTILNLRESEETPGVESAKLAKANGILHVRIPWKGPDQLTDDRLDAMRRVLREAERPLLFHCGSANRVSAGWLAYRVLDEGVDLEAAVAEAKTFGLRTPAYETITRGYIARQTKR